MDVSTAFLALSATIFIGFSGNYLFRKYGAPDILVLILLGFLIGPGGLGIIDTGLTTKIDVITPYVAAIALSIIMFEAGMDLKIKQVLGSFGPAMLHTILAFIMSTVAVAILASVFLGWHVSVALVLGATLGGTSGAIVIPLVKKLNLSEKTITILTLESALTDVLVIVIATSMLVLVMDTSTGLDSAVMSLLIDFTVSLIVGLVTGIIWLFVLNKLIDQPFSYIATIGALVTVYAMTDIIAGQTGAGAVAALVFGMVLGNKNSISRLLFRQNEKLRMDDRIKDFNSEISFFVRSFFFVFLGIVASTISYTYSILLFAGLVFLILVIVRSIVSWLDKMSMQLGKTDTLAYNLIMPRGLSAAVVASIPLSLKAIPDDLSLLILGTTVLVILMTTALASIGGYYLKKIEGR
jgi:potassium/hydrogen antiporter